MKKNPIPLIRQLIQLGGWSYLDLISEIAKFEDITHEEAEKILIAEVNLIYKAQQAAKLRPTLRDAAKHDAIYAHQYNNFAAFYNEEYALKYKTYKTAFFATYNQLKEPSESL